jgi:integrase
VADDGASGWVTRRIPLVELRHKGNQLAAEAGATTGELMRRMGHSTVRAAMRYQHSTDRRDREIAAEMCRRAGAARTEST